MEKFTVKFLNGREPVVIEGETFADAISKSDNKDWSYADFFGKDFTGANCRYTNFTGANFAGADCPGANFAGADCPGANFAGADFTGANFAGADCPGANFAGADCPGANFAGANFTRADCRGANFTEANFAGADCREANFTEADLDFSCWPLRCGSLNVKIDKRLFVQLLYHAVRAGQSVEDDEVQALLSDRKVVKLCNQFHRLDECGKIEAKGSKND